MQNTAAGLIIVNTGNGKGKTTAAFGLALRAAGHGIKVLILQFMKGQKNIGEIEALTKSNLPIKIKRFGRQGFVQSRACETLDIYLADRGLKYFRDVLLHSDCGMIILDEILMAIEFGLLKEKALREILEMRPPHIHIILTGRNASDLILDMADLVTEMKETKHPYKMGVKAQVGIEY